jgi:hypothetical protein
MMLTKLWPHSEWPKMLEAELVVMQGEGWLICVARLNCKATIVSDAEVVLMIQCVGIFGRHFLRDCEEVGGTDHCRGNPIADLLDLAPDVAQKGITASKYDEYDGVHRNVIEVHANGCNTP